MSECVRVRALVLWVTSVTSLRKWNTIMHTKHVWQETAIRCNHWLKPTVSRRIEIASTATHIYPSCEPQHHNLTLLALFLTAGKKRVQNQYFTWQKYFFCYKLNTSTMQLLSARMTGGREQTAFVMLNKYSLPLNLVYPLYLRIHDRKCFHGINNIHVL